MGHNTMLKNVARLVAAFLLLVLPVVALIGWMHLRADWLLSATSKPDGVQIDIYWGDTDTPHYSTFLSNCSISRDIERVPRELLPPDVATTTFYDVTARPGRWTLVMDDTEIDIMPAGLDIDGVPIVSPQE
jgi:hypothetical protein